MKTVVVITNYVEGYDTFIFKLHLPYAEGFRFIRVEDMGRLNEVLKTKLPDLFVRLSVEALHHEGIAIENRLLSFGVHKIDFAYDFTKDTPEISKYL